MPQTATQHNLVEYSVSEISGALKRMVEDSFGHVRLRGEVSGWKGAHSSGHGYFRLKDENACIDAVCWRGTLSKMSFKMAEGLEVICTGRITTYPGKSSYQIVVESMEPAGVGALMALLEQRKKMLEAEGLFKPERKKALPFMPQHIGVITSPTGAVIRDILHRITDRFPCQVTVWPVAVQGEGAAEQIAAAIEGFNQLAQKPQLLIVARGGGSLEDLWAFNEEVVVRAAANSSIPLISAVGHETDTTLIDYASDRRAPTPTAAAEMAVPVREEWLLTIMDHGKRVATSVIRGMQQRGEQLQGLARGLPNPAQLLDHAQQRFDDWTERLGSAFPALLAVRSQQLAVASAGLKPIALQRDIERHSKDLDASADRMNQIYLRRLEQREQKLDALSAMLDSLNYHQVLERGFVMVKNAAGQPVTTAAAIKPEQSLTLVFKDGERKVKAEKISNQGRLFE